MNATFLRTVLFVACLYSCNRDTNKDIILQIGKYTLTKTELASKIKNDRYKSLGNRALEEKLIEEGRIIACTLDERYDTLSALNLLLQYALRAYTSGQYTQEKGKQIIRETAPDMHDTAIDELASRFNALEKNWPGLDPALALVEYTFDGRRVYFRAANFIEFVQNEPMFLGNLDRPEDVKKMLYSCIIKEYLFAAARKKNIESNPDYRQFKKSYQEKLFIEHYKRNHLYPKLFTPIADHDLEAYYQRNSHRFQTFESATAAVYTFKDRQQVFQGRQRLFNQLKGTLTATSGRSAADTMQLPKAAVVTFHMNDSGYNPRLIQAISKLSVGQVSAPIEVNGAYLLIVLSSKKGLVSLPYLYAKEELKQAIYAQKEKQLTAQLDEALQARYPIGNNLVKTYLLQVKREK